MITDHTVEKVKSMCLQRPVPSRSELTSSADQLRVSELVDVAELASRRWQVGFGWVSVYGVFVPPGPFPPTWDAWDDCYSSSLLHKTVKQMKQRDLRSPSTGEGRRETGTEKKKKGILWGHSLGTVDPQQPLPLFSRETTFQAKYNPITVNQARDRRLSP